MSTLSILALVSGVIGALSLAPQAYKIFKRKSAKDISILTYVFFTISGVIWIAYGFELMNWSIILPQIVGGISVVFIIIGWWLYGRSKKNNVKA